MSTAANGQEKGLKWWLTYVIIPLIGSGGIIAIIVAYINQPTDPPNSPCFINVSEISVSKRTVEIGEDLRASVRADNPNGRPMLFNWQAVHGMMEPSLRSKSSESVYTAPKIATDDTISVDVTMTGCEPVRKSIEISIASP